MILGRPGARCKTRNSDPQGQKARHESRMDDAGQLALIMQTPFKDVYLGTANNTRYGLHLHRSGFINKILARLVFTNAFSEMLKPPVAFQ